MKLHPLTISGALIASGATGIYAYLGIREFFGLAGTIPFMFLLLLLGMVLISLVTWFRPKPMPIWLAFIGIMLSTYNGASALGDAFVSALVSGLPFVLASILVLIGEKRQAPSATNPVSGKNNHIP